MFRLKGMEGHISVHQLRSPRRRGGYSCKVQAGTSRHGREIPEYVAELLHEAEVEARIDGAAAPPGTVSLRWDAAG